MIVTEKTNPELQSAIGGKARNLLHLVRNGVVVPPFFCIDSEAFARFVEPHRELLEPLFREARVSDPTRASASIVEVLSSASMDAKLADAISDEIAPDSESSRDTLYSVRSSALSEDSADHSFAGLFTTFLYVPRRQILERIRQCWLSAYGANVLQYCLKNRVDPAEIRLGVIVQEMIDGRRSGVMFTANPTGSLTETMIVAGYGVGEGVVSNRVETDVYIYDSETGSHYRTISKKKKRVVFDLRRQEGVAIEDLPPQLREAAVLQSTDIERLIAVGAHLTALFKHFQDIEWCIDEKGQLYILQSRPITTIPRGRRTIFDNSNIVESFPGMTSPLSFSIVQKMYREVLFRMFARLLPRAHVRTHADRFEHLLGYVEGRVYYDIINWYEMYKLLPLSGRFIVGAFDNLVGLYRGSDPRRFGVRQRKRHPLLTVPFLWSVTWRFVFLRGYLRSYKRRFKRFYAAALGPQACYSNRDIHDLFSQFTGIFDRYMTLASAALINDFFLMIFIGRTKALMQRYEIIAHDDLFNRLMCAEGVESAIPVQEAVRMASMLRADEPLRHDLQAVSTRQSLEAVLQKRENAAFAMCFRQYVERYGDRCPEELKLETVTFREDPLALLKTILAYVPLEITIDKIRGNEQAIRREAQQDVARHLATKPVRRTVLTYCLNRTRALIANRESARLDRGRAFGLMRTVLRDVGRRLHEEKAIGAPEDIFYLTVEQLSGYVYGCSLERELSVPIERNRQLLARYRQAMPADRLHFSGTVGRNLVCDKRSRQEDTGSERVLRGIPCSPGELTAEAVLVEDPGAAPDVAGKIIVAQMTDPGWIFLMIVAAGLIVEKGSVLSHTAIIGREFGIPTIVGVRDATKRIRSGSRVTMRADIGEVELC